MINRKFLSKNEIEFQANRLLMRHYESDSILNIKPPIDIEDIADRTIKVEYDYDFCYEAIKKDDVLGYTEFNKRQMVIDEWLYENCSEGRVNFTIAHEIGHVVLHSPSYDAENKQELINPLKLNCVKKSGITNHWLEMQSNSFAASLLMPKELIFEEISRRDLDIDKGIEYYTDHLFKAFKVSKQAMRIRLKNLEIFKNINQLEFNF